MKIGKIEMNRQKWMTAGIAASVSIALFGTGFAAGASGKESGTRVGKMNERMEIREDSENRRGFHHRQRLEEFDAQLNDRNEQNSRPEEELQEDSRSSATEKSSPDREDRRLQKEDSALNESQEQGESKEKSETSQKEKSGFENKSESSQAV